MRQGSVPVPVDTSQMPDLKIKIAPESLNNLPIFCCTFNIKVTMTHRYSTTHLWLASLQFTVLSCVFTLVHGVKDKQIRVKNSGHSIFCTLANRNKAIDFIYNMNVS